jgi:tRNA nucleotidyltransferase (CCA-adding enzyme)
MLKEPFVLKCLRRLHSVGGFEFFKEGFCPNLSLLKNIERRIAMLHEEFFYRNLEWSSVYLMALFDKVSVPEIKQMASKFHLTKAEKEFLLENREIPKYVARLKRKNLRPSHVYWILHNLPIEIVYFMRVQTSSAIVGSYIDAFLLQSRFVKLSITGDDLKKHGVSSGKRMGVILDNILSKKIDGELKTRREELKEIKKLGR